MSKRKKVTIPKAIKQLVWNTYIGEQNGAGKCQCCQRTNITQMSFQCGHIISEFNGGKVTIDNLKPICPLCNSSMGTKNMNDFITEHGLDKIVKPLQNDDSSSDSSSDSSDFTISDDPVEKSSSDLFTLLHIKPYINPPKCDNDIFAQARLQVEAQEKQRQKTLSDIFKMHK